MGCARRGHEAKPAVQPASGVDLLVVGSPDRDNLTDRLERASGEIGRPVNEVVMADDELARRRDSGDGLVASIEAAAVIHVVTISSSFFDQ
jgi:hypothetical protein